MGNNILKGKRGVIFGAVNEMSIAWKTAEHAYDEGAQFVLSNMPAAMRLGNLDELAKKCNAEIIPADASNVADLENLFRKAPEILGGKIDFILHSVAMSYNVRKNKEYDDLDYDFYLKTIDVSALSFHKMIQTANKLDVLNKGASIVALSFLAAHRTSHGYNDMAEAKAMLESISRSFGYILGRDKQIRVNTVSQSPVKSKATNGLGYMEAVIDFSESISPLGNATVNSCADVCVMLFSDYTRFITMQNIFNDGGFSSMAMNNKISNMMRCLKEREE
jgi:enoyl-[acyl-carrier protein] reductase I